jgi:ribonuclease HII
MKKGEPKLVLGIDEAGRGPVLGPMIIAGVLLNPKYEAPLKKLGVKDSKMLPPARREALDHEIRKVAAEIHYVEIPATQIDSKRKLMSLNELEALKIAELIDLFEKKPSKIIIDAPDPIAKKFIVRVKKYTDTKATYVGEHKADVNYPVVSSASIIAKVRRDAAMKEFEKKYGPLGVGYPHDPLTKAFIERCVENGIWPDIVRHSWLTTQRAKERKGQKKLTEW